jgi:hypothetical protein
MTRTLGIFGLTACLMGAQPHPAAKKAPASHPFQAESNSSVSYKVGSEGEDIIEITNVSYELTSEFVTGPKKDQRMMLRKTVHSKQVLGDMGVEATTALEAWPFPSDLKGKPAYSLSVSGTDGHTVDGTIFAVQRGLEDTEWWSVYKLGTAQHLFDTYVPVVGFSISRELLTQRYAGVGVAVDDATDPRLKDPHAVLVLAYASADRVIREVLLTCDDPKQAALLRELEDATRVLTASGKSLRLAISQTYPSAPATVTLQIPIVNDDLDLAHAQVPPKLHLAVFKR